LVAWKVARAAAALARQSLIDEFCLVVEPVAIGRGMALTSGIPDAVRLELIEVRSFGCGVVRVRDRIDCTVPTL